MVPWGLFVDPIAVGELVIGFVLITGSRLIVVKPRRDAPVVKGAIRQDVRRNGRHVGQTVTVEVIGLMDSLSPL